MISDPSIPWTFGGNSTLRSNETLSGNRYECYPPAVPTEQRKNFKSDPSIRQDYRVPTKKLNG
jgi:hypothetical protein